MKRLLFIFNPWSGKAHVKDHLLRSQTSLPKQVILSRSIRHSVQEIAMSIC